MAKHLFLSDERMLQHDTGDHPENRSRLQAILEAFKNSPYREYLNLTSNRFATREELIQVHEAAYVDHVLSLNGKEAFIDNETIVSPGSVQAALLASGLGIELTELVVEGKVRNGFVIVRPPGHHARPSSGMGFCLFNNIAIAAKQALAMGIKRVLIFDFDVHHGNGTQEAFYDEDRVFLIDIHQENLFPLNSGLINETGHSKGRGFTVNIPLPQGSGDEDYLYVFDRVVKPLAVEYKPELILVSGGFDAHESDPLGFMKLTTEGYGRLVEKIKSLAENLCGGKIIIFLEGGYNPFFLAKNVMECVRVLVEETEAVDLVSSITESRLKGVDKIVEEIYDSRSKFRGK